jgi:hypothetical protein
VAIERDKQMPELRRINELEVENKRRACMRLEAERETAAIHAGLLRLILDVGVDTLGLYFLPDLSKVWMPSSHYSQLVKNSIGPLFKTFHYKETDNFDNSGANINDK